MNKLFYLLIAITAASMLGGCFNNGSTAPPPTAFTATAGDGRVTLEWTASPDVDYWIFTATDPSLTAFNWVNLPNSHAYTSVATPFYICGIFSGTPYYFAANGRIEGGPGGPSSPTISATPYNVSTIFPWTAGTGITPAVPNLLGIGYTSLTTCSNTTTSATGNFVAVGAGGAIFTSSDGMSWATPTTPAFTTDLYAVTGYAANQNNPGNPALRWVAVGAGGASIYSLDGNIWTVGTEFNAVSNPANPNNYALRALTQVLGTFLAVGDMGTILSSTDGITWTAQTSGITNNLQSVSHSSIYTAVGDNGTILTSVDGSTWAPQTSTPATTATLRQVTSFGSLIVAVGDGGTIVTSKDAGVTWAEQTLASSPNFIGVAVEAQYILNASIDPELAQFVAIDSLGNAYTSPNGITWSTAAATGTSNVNALVSSGFGYVAVGNAGVTASAF